MKLLEKLAFFTLLASTPIQLGKHFWPDFSFVQGIRLDYLSPTIYFSDIAFVILFFLSIFRLKNEIVLHFKNRYFFFAFAGVIISSLLSQNWLAALFGLLKLLEFIYIAFYVAHTFSKNYIRLSIFIIVLGGLCEVIISFFQLFSQGSIGGPFYYLGERTFNASTPGIALFSFHGQQFLRPYGTFPHPNVLAFYLLTAFIFLLFSFSLKKSLLTTFKLIALFILSIGIFITFSRIVILLYFFVIALRVIYLKGLSKGTKVRVFTICILALASFIAILFDRFGGSVLRDLTFRIELFSIGLSVFLKHALFGVGINNFFYHEIYYQKMVSPTLLQPIHNIFFQWVVQTGLVGAAALMIFLNKLIKKINSKMGFALIVCIFVVGFFDHYLITLQQGQLILSLITGFIFSKVKT